MNGQTKGVHPVLVMLQLVLIYLWTTILNDSDAYVSVYVFCGIGAALCLFDNCVYHSNYRIFTDQRLRNSIFVLSALFSFAVVLANYSIFLRYRNVEMIGVTRNIILNLFHLVLTFLGGFVSFFHIIVFSFCHISDKHPAEPVSTHKGYQVFIISFVLFVAVYASNLFLLEYPGNLSSDSIKQLSQIYSGEYLSAHPYWHSMVIKAIISLGYRLFGEINASVALFSVCQLVFMALCFSYVLLTLYQAGIPMWCICIAFCLYCFQPYNIALSITMWKDVPFSVGAMLMAAAFYRCIHRLGKRQCWNYIVFAVGSILLCLMRTNGILTFGITGLIMAVFLWKKHRELIAVICAVLLFCGILAGPVAASATVDDTDHLESFAIPMQQVARVIYDGCELTQEQEALINKIIDIEKVPEVYLDWLADPIKGEIRKTNEEFFDNNLKLYGKLWLELGVRYPWEYLKAWVDQTKGYWNGGYDYYQYAEMMYDNDLGLEKMTGGNDFLVRVKYLLFGMVRFSALFEPLNSIGLHVWILVLCMVLNIYRKRNEFLMCVPGLVIIAGLLLCTPVFSEFRYAYAVFISIPLILPVTFFPYTAQE